ncbi:BTB/POZ domain-containing protein At4g08455-like isoform X1 [Humulus lupulus]|uniref:BTB/POZ domain-containing protein At4g08455-like isoform X1 n=1 Tax=Humulus lupulus TaxID=3486 RepID=UPI002B40C920|nr:BTB/POZ domain-containing protein At4g08455-like isoform X1 [Humulus lupulus]
MRRRRLTSESQNYETDMDSDSDSVAETTRCISCQEDYDAHDGGTCKECHDEANETEEDLKREIEDLKAKVAFLKLCDPIDYPNHYSTGPRSYSPCFSDVVLVAFEGTSGAPAPPVPAHKAVLVSRSPVFKAMLENEMEESRSSTIKINDVSYEALRAFVNYLYTAEASLNEHMAYSLVVLAEKYQVNHLKTYCERFLISKQCQRILYRALEFRKVYTKKLCVFQQAVGGDL